MTLKGFLVGMFVGGLVGAAAALLYAPQEGAATRRQVSDATHTAMDKVTSAASNVRGRIRLPGGAVKQAI